MTKFLIPLLFMFTTAHADNHGARLTFKSVEDTVWVNVIIRSKPTYEENYAECVSDGEFLMDFNAARGRTDGTYTCEPE